MDFHNSLCIIQSMAHYDYKLGIDYSQVNDHFNTICSTNLKKISMRFYLWPIFKFK